MRRVGKCILVVNKSILTEDKLGVKAHMASLI